MKRKSGKKKKKHRSSHRKKQMQKIRQRKMRLKNLGLDVEMNKAAKENSLNREANKENIIQNQGSV